MFSLKARRVKPTRTYLTAFFAVPRCSGCQWIHGFVGWYVMKGPAPSICPHCGEKMVHEVGRVRVTETKPFLSRRGTILEATFVPKGESPHVSG